ncbi:hypothetical protein NQ315_005656 [Exocentrus adspersus]|uniref:THAP-type domain-containing protein n=1 Tax=Exocentrus adspersus TaxID=1586481 RepID=A0AAV8V7E6_9CUCU|nr:hypothetical protein NQ315_005656 [Exocentrus adspersus]
MISLEEPSTSSGGKAKKQRYNTNCCVYGCHSRKGKDRNIHFHAFPNKNSGIKVKLINAMDQEENIDKRKAWEKVLLMGKPVNKYMRVCSKHFTSEDYCAKGVKMKQPRLKRFTIPSQNLPKKRLQTRSTSKQGPLNLRRQRMIKRQQLKEHSYGMPIGECSLHDVMSVNEPSKSITKNYPDKRVHKLSVKDRIIMCPQAYIHDSHNIDMKSFQTNKKKVAVFRIRTHGHAKTCKTCQAILRVDHVFVLKSQTSQVNLDVFKTVDYLVIKDLHQLKSLSID